MRSLQSLKAQKGFTIVELLIVIVVIGILAALVITTFSGIQERARDTERETDVKAVHGQVEAYYADNGYYPTLAVLVAGLPGLDDEALMAPGNGATQIDAAATTILKYRYNPGPANCNNTTTLCDTYTLEALQENGNTYTKNALN